MTDHLARESHARIWGGLLDLGRVRRATVASAIFRLQVQFAPIGPDGPMQVADPVRYVQHFGFASLPPVGSDVAVVHLKGDRSNAVALGSNHQQHRPPPGMAAGDSAQYDVRGAYVWMTATGIVVDAAGNDVTIQNASGVFITAPAGTKITGSLAVTENLSVGNGATGTFTTPTGQMVTVQDGIVTNID
jgi:phage gp45-like